MRLLARQLDHEPVVVRERPFSRAVVRTLEVGAAGDAEWLVAIDADVLVLSDFVERARGLCARMPSDAFCATALTLCRVVGGLVFRGVHLYRASMLREALGLVDGLAPDLRPESAVQIAMSERGHPKRFIAHAVGVHDHEQYLRHLYLKAKLRARKDEERDAIAASLAARSASDVDALVSSWGFADARTERDGPVEYDWGAAQPGFSRRLIGHGLLERDALCEERADGLAERALAAHDYRSDRVTAPWIRERLRFEDGAPVITEGLVLPGDGR
ncbi:MAG: hypothetical protein AAGH64_08110 [Planctomycetota bacterium]